jgi:glycosyltransferase involved in cell wall biosynthesis
MLFSVIIPFYNRSGMVDEVLASVAGQTEADFEVIAVDDGSADDTLARLESHPLQPRCLRIENSGAPVARNAAAKLAKGQYLAFLDSDDLWFPNTLALYRSIIEEHGEPGIITSKPVLFQSAEEVEAPAALEPELEFFGDYYDAFDDWRWHGVSSFVIRRDAFEQVGGFTNRRMNAEDADLMMKLGTVPGFVHIKAPAPFAYRCHEGNLTGNMSMNCNGIRHMVQTELDGAYPGGEERREQRRAIITRHLRPAIVSGLKGTSGKELRQLYWKTFSWNLKQGRIRFLAFAFLKMLLP